MTDLVDALVRSELLPGLGADAFAAIADELVEIHLDAGDQLVGVGDLAEDLYVVVGGQLAVVLDTPQGTQQLALLQPGAVIGEIGLLAGDTRSATVRAVSPAQLVAVTAEGVRRLLAEHPRHAEELARRATQRLRRTQLIEHFSLLLGGIDPEVLATIEQIMEWTAIPAGTRLFAEGDDGDAAYLVATGRLRVFRRGETGAEVEVGEIGRAELVGEMSIIDGGPRTATVYAVRDTQLIRFSRAAYEELLRRHPLIGLQIAQMALRRTRNAGDREIARRRRLSVVVVPASSTADAHAFASELTAALGEGALCVDSRWIDRDLGRDGIAQITDDDLGALRLGYRLEELEERHRHLVLEIDDGWTHWSRRALRWADHVVLVAESTDDPRPDRLERELWSLVTRQHNPKVSLALLHPPDTVLPRGTQAWLEHRSLASHHHLRHGDAAHMARLARTLAGSANALVLGGGGARGFAHVGVLDVLDDLDVPVDMVGGTSIGSIMAAGVGMGWTPDQLRTTAIDAFQDLFDYTLPAASVLRGRKITHKLQKVFGDVDIVDLWVPYFCVSTNLTHARAEFHDHGPLVRAIRASIAIPGVLPPVPAEGGDLLVDGGVLDNVPVDEMRRRNPTGTVIGVDVAPTDGPVASRDYGMSVSGFRLLRRRHRSAGPPNLVSTMVRSSLLASVRDRERVVSEGIADLYLDIGVDGGGLLDFSTADAIADSGAAATRPVLTRWHTGGGDPALAGYIRTAPPRRSAVLAHRRRRGGGVLLLTRRDLQHRAPRFGAVVVGVSVVFTLLFLMSGLTEQFHREPRDAVAALGADGWLLREGASGAFTSAATMPAGTADAVEGAGADPLVVARHSITSTADPVDVVVIGYRAGGLGEPRLVDGRLPDRPGEVVVDKTAELDLGEDAAIGSQRYEVVGHTRRTTLFAGMPLVFMDLGDAQDLLYRGQELATAILLDGEPASVPDGFTVLEPGAVAEDATRPLERSISSVNLIRVLLWFVAAMIIGTMTYLSALERRRDVAVLKAVGASTRQLGASIALQGAFVALAAALIASVLQVAAVPVFPLEVSVPDRALVQVPVIAVVVALLAGLFGLRSAVRTDPALAFSGPGS